MLSRKFRLVVILANTEPTYEYPRLKKTKGGLWCSIFLICYQTTHDQ